MRIIAGQYRGRILVAPEGQKTRPTADRARETLFSMLVSRVGGFAGLAVADLFAGSGALGLEALSRGASSCLFVEQDHIALAAIRANIAALGAQGTTIIAGSAERPSAARSAFDIVFLDPPYGTVDGGALIDRLIDSGWARAHTIFSLETGLGPEPVATQALHLTSRKVGKAMLHLFRVG